MRSAPVVLMLPILQSDGSLFYLGYRGAPRDAVFHAVTMSAPAEDELDEQPDEEDDEDDDDEQPPDKQEEPDEGGE